MDTAAAPPSADAPEQLSEFDTATAVRPDGALWTGEVLDGWGMGGFPNGGYLVSLAVAALQAATGRSDPIAITTQFLAPARPGRIDVPVEIVRSGRRHTNAVASLRQDDRDVARVLATLGDLDMAAGVGSDAAGTGSHAGRFSEAVPPELPEPDAATRLEPAPGLLIQPPPITDRVTLRLHPDHAGFPTGDVPGQAVMAGWARFADGREADTRSLPLFADAFPPAVFNAGMPPGWVPTVELSVQIRKRPAPGWLRCLFRTRFVTGDYLEEDGEIWDADGDLVALSRQLALAPRANAGSPPPETDHWSKQPR